MINQENKLEEEYWIKHPISFDRQDHDTNSRRGYGNIIINKVLSTVTYTGDIIDYRLLMRILYIDKDVRRTLKTYTNEFDLIPEDSSYRPTISEVEICPDMIDVWFGEMSNEVYEVDSLNVRKKRLFTTLSNQILTVEPLTFTPLELLMLFKVMKLKSRKEELRGILEAWRFRYDIPESDVYIFESDDDLKL